MKSTRRLDGQGRVILPAHIRKALNLSQDSTVTIEMEDDSSIRIRPAAERCCICGEGVTGAPFVQEITVRNETRYVCGYCFAGLHDREGGAE